MYEMIIFLDLPVCCVALLTCICFVSCSMGTSMDGNEMASLDACDGNLAPTLFHWGGGVKRASNTHLHDPDVGAEQVLFLRYRVMGLCKMWKLACGV